MKIWRNGLVEDSCDLDATYCQCPCERLHPSSTNGCVFIWSLDNMERVVYPLFTRRIS